MLISAIDFQTIYLNMPLSSIRREFDWQVIWPTTMPNLPLSDKYTRQESRITLVDLNLKTV